MEKECTKEAPTVAEAVDAALEELGVQQDAVAYEILEEPGKKIFGIGSERDARVRVWVKDEYLKEMQAASQIADNEFEADEAVDQAEEALPAELRAVETPELSDEDLDRVADTAAKALKTILDSFRIEGAAVEEYEGDEGEIILDVVGGDLAILIGRHGRTLDALQTLVSAITSRELGFRHPVIVDVEGYRHRRRQKLEDIARRSADRSAHQHIAVRLRPMTAYERRVVHVALRDDRRVTTQSEGDDPFRVVVINPA
ncbi:MAG: RNA-binding cell elongation regulator Jag/EloR [Coriobacteriia bacterium]